MGVTLHAIIEEFSPGDGKLTRDRWWELGEWNFGKDYDLSGFLFDKAHNHWPNNSDSHINHKIDDQDRQWCEIAIIREAVEKNLGGYTLRALYAALQVVITTTPVRILWYRC